jgi:hypothetical protein
LEEKYRIKLISSIDIIVAVVIMIIGFLVIFLGESWLSYVTLWMVQSSGSSPLDLLGRTPWIIIFIGIATVLYGVKRIVDDLSKIP